MPGGNDYGEPKGSGRGHIGWQRISNESWPLVDDAGDHARGIDDQPTPIAVDVRVQWERDGETWIPGSATRWTTSHVFVRIDDPRSLLGFVWVQASDVRRR